VSDTRTLASMIEDRTIFKMAEVVLFYGFVGALILWQLWDVRPSKRKADSQRERDQAGMEPPIPWWQRR
jgi:hypothetical protein